MPKVYLAALKERTIGDYAQESLDRIYYRAGQLGYIIVPQLYARTDWTRNNITKHFAELAEDTEDTLVMLDCDHRHPPDIVERLVAHNKPVVGALAFRRGEPYFPCVFFRDPQGVLRKPKHWEQKLYRVSAVGTGAVAIQAGALQTLGDKGFEWPWFRYVYPAGPVHPSEDMYFNLICEQAGVPVYCDFSLVTPHITVGVVDDSTWAGWLADHPDGLADRDGELCEIPLTEPEPNPLPSKPVLPEIKTKVNL